MKVLQIKQLDEKDTIITETLISLGMNRNITLALTCLQNMNSATSLDLDKRVNLRQPEVSIAMKQLKEYDWITEREENKIGKGRPNKVYSLKVGFNDIVNHLEKQQKKAFDEAKEKIERLKDLGNKSKN